MFPSWHRYFLDLVGPISSKSKDRSTKVGCIIVGPNNEIRSTGFNGFCRGVNDEIKGRHQRPTKYMWTEHAERNAIYNAARNGVSLEGCRIYIDFIPCVDCARGIIQSGIKEIVIDGFDFAKKEAYWNERWKESMDCSKEMLAEAGIKITLA